MILMLGLLILLVLEPKWKKLKEQDLLESNNSQLSSVDFFQPLSVPTELDCLLVILVFLVKKEVKMLVNWKMYLLSQSVCEHGYR